MGHPLTVQNQIRRRKTRRLIRLSTVCLQPVHLSNDRVLDYQVIYHKFNSHWFRFIINQFKPIFSFYGTSANSAKPGQTPLNAASDQVLHCLLTACSFKVMIECSITR